MSSRSVTMRRREIEALLPAVYQAAIRPGSPLDAILEVAARLPQPSEELLARMDSLFDPRRTPEAMVPFLARWVDLDRFLPRLADDGAGGMLPSGLGRLRELCCAAADLSRLRGTPRGLIRFLEIATGHTGFELHENLDREGRHRPFHLRVTAPAAAAPHEALIHTIIESEKPAYVTYDRKELQFR
ncbi:phage tail protein [Ectothiorhodospira lacustris]|uniref:phage tail protein n=1 Tax=Ectothiorhodospira lacustris TaxID=2899127 RepID=UPI001EE82F8B|nr:phage tail protein [Ectothiorhodospira lacustris]MCG5511224.1 phage tail protein [Ectothiorhodospira lacustris]MCG5522960.1 phage tail protein [Ectothiorhodospira lacustris]